MRDLSAFNRVLYRHDWINVEEWVGSLHALADLNDAEIEEITGRTKLCYGRLF